MGSDQTTHPPTRECPHTYTHARILTHTHMHTQMHDMHAQMRHIHAHTHVCAHARNSFNCGGGLRLEKIGSAVIWTYWFNTKTIEKILRPLTKAPEKNLIQMIQMGKIWDTQQEFVPCRMEVLDLSFKNGEPLQKIVNKILEAQGQIGVKNWRGLFPLFLSHQYSPAPITPQSGLTHSESLGRRASPWV